MILLLDSGTLRNSNKLTSFLIQNKMLVLASVVTLLVFSLRQDLNLEFSESLTFKKQVFSKNSKPTIHESSTSNTLPTGNISLSLTQLSLCFTLLFMIINLLSICQSTCLPRHHQLHSPQTVKL